MHDRAWVRLMLSGDRAAGEHFVTTYYTRIERLLRCLTGTSEVACDLTQQTFVKAWQALPGFAYEASLATWLHKIAYHEYTHWLRDKGNTEHAPLEAAWNVPAPASLLTDWGIALLPEALAQLADDLREAFLLYYVQELSVPEVANVLNIPRGTVKSRLFTARQRLRGLLEQTMQDTGIQSSETKSTIGPGTKMSGKKVGGAVSQERPEIPAAYRIEPTQKGGIHPLVQALTSGDQGPQEVEGGLR